MKTPTLPHRAIATGTAIALAISFTSCRKRDAAPTGKALIPAVIASELATNQTSALSSPVYQSQVKSPIHWQTWSKDTLERAREAQRLVFCVVAMPQHNSYMSALESLSTNDECVGILNNEYVPILVDADAARELSILSSDLCAEIREPLGMPMFMWLTHEGNPVAWIPVSSADAKMACDIFAQSHIMISQMWRDDPAYVIKNSRIDNENRRARLSKRKNIKLMSKEPAKDLLLGLRQLSSLYDPVTRNFDETGGLFPTSSLELLAAAGSHPELPADLRETCRATARELIQDLIGSPMFDPLDGGVFTARRGNTWSLPNFTKDCVTQARVACTLIEASRNSDTPLVLERALGILNYAESQYALGDGLFAIGTLPPTRPSDWMWTVEEIRELLAPEDAEWWIQATQMSGLGNLPSEVDPQREYFRNNTIGIAQRPAQIAAQLGEPPEQFANRFEKVRKKLLAARNAKLGDLRQDRSPSAPATLRMASAYAAAYQATGKSEFREKAVQVLTAARNTFTNGQFLYNTQSDAPDSVVAGRNFLYALALQAALDLAAITLDQSWLVWSEDLATTATELFTGDDILKECPDPANLLNLPVTDLVMLFDDSSAGLISMSECRLAAIGRPLVKKFSELATPLPTYARERPVLHTDLFYAALARHYSITAVYGKNLSLEMQQALSRLPLRSIHRRAATADDGLADGAIELRFGKDGRNLLVETPSALMDACISPMNPGQ